MSAKNDLDPQSNNTTGSTEQAGETGSVSDSNGSHKEQKDKGNQENKLKEGIDDGKKIHENMNGQSGSKKTDNVVKDVNNLNEKLHGESDDSKKKTKPKESGDGEEPGHTTKGSHVEECDPSNKCVDEDSKLVACLRVPGNGMLFTFLNTYMFDHCFANGSCFADLICCLFSYKEIIDFHLEYEINV